MAKQWGGPSAADIASSALTKTFRAHLLDAGGDMAFAFDLAIDMYSKPNKKLAECFNAMAHDPSKADLVRIAFTMVAIETFPEIVRYHNGRTTLLYEAVRNELLGVVKLLLARGADVNQESVDQKKPIHMAMVNDVSIARYLLDHGADINAVESSNGFTPLHIALSKGYAETARLLLDRGADVRVSTKDGMTPLHSAVYGGFAGGSGGRVDVIRRLLAKGARIDAVDAYKSTPLRIAVDKGDAASARFLMDLPGTDLTSWIEGRGTLIDQAALTGNVEILRDLLDRGVDIETPNLETYPPLHVTIAEGHTKAIKFLLQRGADIERATQSGHRPLHIAAQHGRTEILRILLDRGASIDAATPIHTRPIHSAIANNHVEALKILAKRGASFGACGSDGDFPVHYAAALGMLDILAYLLSRPDTDIDARNSMGITPIMFAVSQNKVDAIRFLLEKGAKLPGITTDPPALSQSPTIATIATAVQSKHIEALRLLGVQIVAGYGGHGDDVSAVEAIIELLADPAEVIDLGASFVAAAFLQRDDGVLAAHLFRRVKTRLAAFEQEKRNLTAHIAAFVRHLLRDRARSIDERTRIANDFRATVLPHVKS